MSQLITMQNNQPVVSHRVIAERTDNQEVSIRNILNKYKDDLEEFGGVHFKNEGDIIVKEKQKGNPNYRPTKEFFLNEQQTTLLVTFLKNSLLVRAFKVALVKEFYKLREEVYQKQAAITIVNTTDKERLGTLETHVYMLKNENRELRRAMNRMSYNDKHLDSEVVTFEDEPVTCTVPRFAPVKITPIKVVTAKKKVVKVITPVKEVVENVAKGITPGRYRRLWGKKDLVTVIAVEHGNVILLDENGAGKVNIVDFQKFFEPAKNFLESL